MGPKSQNSPSRQRQMKAKAWNQKSKPVDPLKNPYSQESLKLARELKEREQAEKQAEKQRKDLEKFRNNTNGFRDHYLKRCDLGLKPCPRCNKGNSYKHGHDRTCYVQWDHHNRKNSASAYVPPKPLLIDAIYNHWDEGEEFMRGLAPPLKSNLILHGVVKRDDVTSLRPHPSVYYDTSNDPYRAPQARATQIPLKDTLKDVLGKPVTAELLRKAIPIIMDSWKESDRKALEETMKVPLPIAAIVQYFRMQFPRLYTDKETGLLKMGGDYVDWFKKQFPRGVISFQVPAAGRKYQEIVFQ